MDLVGWPGRNVKVYVPIYKDRRSLHSYLDANHRTYIIHHVQKIKDGSKKSDISASHFVFISLHR